MTKIYESPDGGKTVYTRDFLDNNRVIVKEELSHSKVGDFLERQEWHQILLEAKTNPTLQDAINRVKVLYHLSKNHGEK